MADNDVRCPHCHARLNPPQLKAARALLRDIRAWLDARPAETPAIREFKTRIDVQNAQECPSATPQSTEAPQANTGWPGTPDERAP